MSQSATLFPIDSNDFATIKKEPNNLNLDQLKHIENHVTFPGTHEGLRFVLSKGLDKEKADLINEIFYPTTYIGEVSQYVFPDSDNIHEFVDVTDDEDFENFDREPISFLDPDKIKQIALLLETISDEHLLSRFDPDELNRENIYPWCWNMGIAEDQVYNERHILQDFQNLRRLFEKASVMNNYVLCFVG